MVTNNGNDTTYTWAQFNGYHASSKPEEIANGKKDW